MLHVELVLSLLFLSTLPQALATAEPASKHQHNVIITAQDLGVVHIAIPGLLRQDKTADAAVAHLYLKLVPSADGFSGVLDGFLQVQANGPPPLNLGRITMPRPALWKGMWTRNGSIVLTNVDSGARHLPTVLPYHPNVQGTRTVHFWAEVGVGHGCFKVHLAVWPDRYSEACFDPLTTRTCSLVQPSPTLQTRRAGADTPTTTTHHGSRPAAWLVLKPWRPPQRALAAAAAALETYARLVAYSVDYHVAMGFRGLLLCEPPAQARALARHPLLAPYLASGAVRMLEWDLFTLYAGPFAGDRAGGAYFAARNATAREPLHSSYDQQLIYNYVVLALSSRTCPTLLLFVDIDEYFATPRAGCGLHEALATCWPAGRGASTAATTTGGGAAAAFDAAYLTRFRVAQTLQAGNDSALWLVPLRSLAGRPPLSPTNMAESGTAPLSSACHPLSLYTNASRLILGKTMVRTAMGTHTFEVHRTKVRPDGVLVDVPATCAFVVHVQDQLLSRQGYGHDRLRHRTDWLWMFGPQEHCGWGAGL